MRVSAEAGVQHNGTRSANCAKLAGKGRKLLLVMSATLIGFIIAECALRLVGISFPRTSRTDVFRGTARIPAIEWRQTSEGESHVQINRDGFRDRDHVIEKPKGTVRIAVLGDSYVEALQVEREKRFTELLEQQLNERRCFGSKNVEVLNFGVSGYGTVQELMTLRHCVWRYKPDIVILAFLPGNDVRNNSKLLQNDLGRPYFIFRHGNLEFDSSFRSSPDYIKTWWERMGYACIDRSRVCQLLYHARNSIYKSKAREAAGGSVKGVHEELGLDIMVYKIPDDDIWTEAWRITDALLVLTNKDVVEKGVTFLVVTLTSGAQVDPVPSVRQILMDKLGVDTLLYPAERIKSLGDREGFAVFNLAPRFQQFAEIHKVYLHGFGNTTMGKGHWNERGHQLAAQLITDEICRSNDP